MRDAIRAEGPAAIRFEAVDIVFGRSPERALPLIDAGKSREEILDATGQVVGVAQASLRVRAGEICVLMGLSGSGKSTLLRAVNGLTPVTRGRVWVRDGEREVEVSAADPATLRHLRTRRIAMVFQQFALLPWRTVAENVAFALELRGTPRAERERIVRDKLALVGLERWAEKRVEELSGGMQQRVGLARALATDADILLMDEPFSALDPLIRDRLQDELLELQRRLAKTVLFVSHDLDEALKLGSRIAIMEGGRIVQEGTPEDIVLRPRTAYVRSFVANVNPLNVLRLRAVMAPLRGVGEGEVSLGERNVTVRLDSTGRPVAARAGRVELRLERLMDGTAPQASGEVVYLAPEGASVRLAAEALAGNERPLLVVDEGGRLVGWVDAQGLLRGLGRRRA